MGLPETSKATEPGGTGIHCSKHNYTSPPNSKIVICPQCRIDTILKTNDPAVAGELLTLLTEFKGPIPRPKEKKK